MELFEFSTNDIHNRCKIYSKYYDPAVISLIDPQKERYVFGDNTARFGCGGQAVIRYYPQSFGIVTKRLPSRTSTSEFFTDSLDDWLLIEADLIALHTLMETSPNLIVHFPEHGLGTGLSEMPTRCPNLFKKMNDVIKERFGIDYASLNPV